MKNEPFIPLFLKTAKHFYKINMPLTLFIWILFSRPFDRPVCSMWVSQAPTQAALAQAGCLWTADQAKGYVWRGMDYRTGQVLCERPASELPNLTCVLSPLDHYFIKVYEPNYRQNYCLATLQHEGPPTQADLVAQCPKAAAGALGNGQAQWQFITSGPAPVADPAPVICPLPALTPEQLPADASGLATHANYQLLAYQLRWYYGTDADMDDWQNQLDPDIWRAGQDVQVPPRLLKAMFAQETQFWPLNDPVSPSRGETGLGQLTDDGADLVLHYSPDLFEQWCHVAIDKSFCIVGYELLSPDQRQMVRDVLRAALNITGTPRQAMQEARGQIETWAMVLKAFYCAAGEIVRPAGVGPSWEFALAAYHSGPECVRGGEICPGGQKYVEEVEGQ
jgi:hypothetical protein